MTKLQWDAVGSRKFEAGCDRGVLYLPDGSAVPWNGLTSVTDDTGDTAIEDHFLDGVKYLSRRIVGDYSGTLKALTYPDEFMQFDGIVEWDDGLFATGQSVSNTFGLSYRTLLGSDISDLGAGYRLHVLYNLVAKPDSRNYGTLTDKISAEEFGWTLSGVPVYIPGLRPTVHMFIDSTRVSPGSMLTFEAILYGTDTTDGRLPDADEWNDIYADIISEPLAEPI